MDGHISQYTIIEAKLKARKEAVKEAGKKLVTRK